MVMILCQEKHHQSQAIEILFMKAFISHFPDLASLLASSTWDFFFFFFLKILANVPNLYLDLLKVSRRWVICGLHVSFSSVDVFLVAPV